MFFKKKKPFGNNVKKLDAKFLESLSVATDKKRLEMLTTQGFVNGGFWDIGNDLSAKYYSRLFSTSNELLSFIPEVIMLHKRKNEISYNIFAGFDNSLEIPQYLQSFFLDIINSFNRSGYRTYPEHGINDMKLKVLDKAQTKSYTLKEMPSQNLDNGAIFLKAVICYIDDKKCRVGKGDSHP